MFFALLHGYFEELSDEEEASAYPPRVPTTGPLRISCGAERLSSLLGFSSESSTSDGSFVSEIEDSDSSNDCIVISAFYFHVDPK
ncbi:hypothetical protein A2U01_0039681, partial [Trifolium medium]|nr:hypothetical protein [Trifolium medium]